MKEKDWNKVKNKLPNNDALCLLVCDHPEIEGGCFVELGYYDGFRWMKEDSREQVFPTHWMKIVLPKED